MADSILVGIPEIAELADVTRAAVSNWRKRYDDFPEPKVQSESGVLFDLRQVEEWMLTRGKIDQPIPHGALVWRFAEALRASWSGEKQTGGKPSESASSMMFDFVSSWLCYLEACDRATTASPEFDGRQRAAVQVEVKHRWETVERSADQDLPVDLREAARVIEAANPELDGLLEGLGPDPFPDSALVRSFVAELEAARKDLGPLELFERAQRNALRVGRSEAESTTPDALVELVAQLVGPIDAQATIVDPACGTAGLLLRTASGSGPWVPGRRIVGVEVDPAAARLARSRLFLAGVDGEIDVIDSLRRDPREWPVADVVVCDPPWYSNNWGDGDLYRTRRWRFGAPPTRSADFAWLQLALEILKPHGAAAVLLPPESCSQGMSEREIRGQMVLAGVVEAVIQLPPRLRRDMSKAVTLWLLRSPSSPQSFRSPVLLVDASKLGKAGRSTHELEKHDIEQLATVVRQWRAETSAASAGKIVAVAVSADELERSGWDLSPRRHLPLPAPADVRELETAVLNLKAVADEAAAQVQKALVDLSQMREAQGFQGVTKRVRLGDVAEIFQSFTSSAETDGSALEGDLLLTVGPDGVGAELATSGQSLAGRHAVVVRPREGGEASGPWLYVWAQTDEFAELIGRRSMEHKLSPKDLKDLEVGVPGISDRDRARDLLEVLDRLDQGSEKVTQAVASLRSAELRLAYAQVNS